MMDLDHRDACKNFADSAPLFNVMFYGRTTRTCLMVVIIDSFIFLLFF
jgi:hypothetical protein